MKKHLKTALILVGLIFLLGGAFTVDEPTDKAIEPGQKFKNGLPALRPIQPD
ncbi:hypothetical protein [Pseudoalteromonas sp. R3]|uniref:hypothetical protein n=1 Tax=Pseudoalteromonas sp. R3 TaxID=1709477 RepID=UPI000A4ACEC9|nr:hypothetical protein [Pseudoalteromonas sp. R3]